MRIGLFVPLTGPSADARYLKALGESAERCGFASLWAAEHVVLFDEYASRYPYSKDGRVPLRAPLEPFTALTFLAACTSRIRLGTGICLVPQRNPVYTAKVVATLDFLSGGRVDFGVGIGWLREEFAAVGVPWQKRGERTLSYLEVMKRLWRDEVAEYHDEFYQLLKCRQDPKPVQKPNPPIFFGGESDAALRRVASAGDGWYGFNLTPDVFAERVARLEVLLREAGRSRADVQIFAAPNMATASPEHLTAYHKAGCDQLIVLALARHAAEVSAQVERVADRWLSPARRLA